MNRNCVAIYLDFENLAICAEQVYPKEEFPVQVEAIVDYAANKGVVTIKKAYANWNNSTFRKYQRVLVEQGFDLIHLPETAVQGKSWADVRLTVAVLEDVALHGHLQTIVLGSQDTDFVPLLQAIKTKGLEVVVAGFNQFVGNLLKKNCTEFVSLAQIFAMEGEQQPEEEEYDLEGLFRRLLSSHSAEEPIFMTNLKQDFLKLDPSFSERQLGFQSFSLFVRSLVGKYVDRIEKNRDKGVDMVYLKPIGKGRGKRNQKQLASEFLMRSIRYIKQKRQRIDILKDLLGMEALDHGLALPEIIDRLLKLRKLEPVQTNRFIYQLYNAGVLVQASHESEGPFDSRKMLISAKLESAEQADRAYRDRVKFLLMSRFPALNAKDLEELVG